MKLKLTLTLGTVAFAAAAELKPAYETLTLGEVRPAGWLRQWCESARDGYTGHLHEYNDQFARAWATNFTPQTSLQWWDREDPKTGKKELGFWSAEGGAYWYTGLIGLAYEMDDPYLKDLIHRRLDGLLERMNPKAISFCWWFDRWNAKRWNDLGDGWFFGPCGALARGLCEWYRVTKDPKILQALEWAFDDRRFYGHCYISQPAAGAAIYRLGGNPDVKTAVDDFYLSRVLKAPRGRRDMPFATEDELVFRNARIYLDDPDEIEQEGRFYLGTPVIPAATSRQHNFQHGVITHEALACWIAGARWTGTKHWLERAVKWMDWLDAHCGQPHGVMVADEYYGATGGTRGTETCTVSLDLETRLALLGATGSGRWGDGVERTFFNAAPAAIGRDFRHHCYAQVPNQKDRNSFRGFSTGCVDLTVMRRCQRTKCCMAALNRMLPDFIRGAWMRLSDGGLVACLWAPMKVRTKVGNRTVAIDVATEYPFGETIAVTVSPDAAAEFPLRLRLPGWCAQPSLTLNGAPLALAAKDGFATVTRTWRPGDRLVLTLPMTASVREGYDCNRQGTWKTPLYVSVSHGPLLYALGVPEKPGTDENEPADPSFKVDYRLDPKTVLKGATFVRKPLPAKWNWPFDAPARLTVHDREGQPLELIPYGCTKLRWTMFDE